VPYNTFADNTSIFICLANAASQICEFAVQGHSVIDLGANGNCIFNFLLCNFGRISFRFRDWRI